MFNQKVNGYSSANPEYLNYSRGAPSLSPLDIHRCGTTINKYNYSGCSSLPLQSWCSTDVAVESFAMRPIVNPKEYFDNINKYLASVIYTDSVNLKQSGLTNDHYYILNDYGYEPESSLMQAIKLEVSDKLSYYMSATVDQVKIFKEANPLCEGFVITDIDITVYRSQENRNHYFHKILFSAFNTTRYNTVSFKAEAYQDTTPMMQEWNQGIAAMSSSSTGSNSIIYVSMIHLLNNTVCVTGQEDSCDYKGYNITSSFSQLLNDNFLKQPSGLMWEKPDAISRNVYNNDGNYDEDGHIRITDYGPSNLDQLIKSFKLTN